MQRNLGLTKTTCKICSKSFASGKALGGHMRSHPHSSWEAEERDKAEVTSMGQAGFGAGYDLRENPKKTCRLSDFVGEGEDSYSKNGEDCGKGFPFRKDLFGQTRTLPAKTSSASLETEGVDEEGCGKGKKDSLENFSDDHGLLPPPEGPKKKRWSKRASPDIAAAGSSSSITDYEPEQEEVAISLMMLSRDITGYLTGAESSDKNSVIMEEEFLEDSIGGYLERKKAKVVENGNPSNFFNAHEAKPRSGYQCATCKKSFPSYHALGGHRASHKRIGSFCSPMINNGGGQDSSTRTDSSKKSRPHECVICAKVFSSAQALGGHKRSHFAPGGGAANQQMLALSQLLDLNLPASLDAASSNI